MVASLVTTKQGILLEPPKTDRGRRAVNLDDLTVAVLREHRARQMELAAQLGMEPP